MRTQPVAPGSEPFKNVEPTKPKTPTPSKDVKAKEVSQKALKNYKKEAIEIVRQIKSLKDMIGQDIDKHQKSTQETREISQRIFDLEQKLEDNPYLKFTSRNDLENAVEG